MTWGIPCTYEKYLISFRSGHRVEISRNPPPDRLCILLLIRECAPLDGGAPKIEDWMVNGHALLGFELSWTSVLHLFDCFLAGLFFFFAPLPLKSLSGVPVVCRHGFGERAQGHLFQAITIDSVDV